MILVTGVAGFIGHAVAQALLERGDDVVGVDNLNDYYDPMLKRARLERLRAMPRFQFVLADLADRAVVEEVFASYRRISSVVHLAAQAGVRYSLTHPHAYIDANVVAFMHLLEQVRAHPVRHFLYASSSSVYGANTKMPFSEDDRVDHPVSLYAATKRANELMAEVYARQFGIALTGLRFFTVYGPWGRPDMAAMRFAAALCAGRPIDVYNHGDMQRDFTYIDDAVDVVLRIHDRMPAPRGGMQHRVFNVGSHRPVALLRFIDVLSSALGVQPELQMKPLQPGDVKETYADIQAVQQEYGWVPSTTIGDGLKSFARWYLEYEAAKTPGRSCNSVKPYA
jgi:UDP-glucuronate 4-epimerase